MDCTGTAYWGRYSTVSLIFDLPLSFAIITILRILPLPPDAGRGGGEGNPFGSVCIIYGCPAVHPHNSNTVNSIDLNFLRNEGSARSSVLLEFGIDPHP
jgi:hypothetical protein